MEAFLACWTTRGKREFESGSAPPRAATVISLHSLPKILPFAFAAISLCLAFHCAPIAILLFVYAKNSGSVSCPKCGDASISNGIFRRKSKLSESQRRRRTHRENTKGAGIELFLAS